MQFLFVVSILYDWYKFTFSCAWLLLLGQVDFRMAFWYGRKNIIFEIKRMFCHQKICLYSFDFFPLPTSGNCDGYQHGWNYNHGWLPTL